MHLSCMRVNVIPRGGEVAARCGWRGVAALLARSRHSSHTRVLDPPESAQDIKDLV